MLRIKKLDIFILKSFCLLFTGTFFICLFIFMMQFLWKYVDQMVGKGLDMSVLAQFFIYAGLTLVPASLPLAVLLAALITFGNFGERFELMAMKAAGGLIGTDITSASGVHRFHLRRFVLLPECGRTLCTIEIVDIGTFHEAEIA